MIEKVKSLVVKLRNHAVDIETVRSDNGQAKVLWNGSPINRESIFNKIVEQCIEEKVYELASDLKGIGYFNFTNLLKEDVKEQHKKQKEAEKLMAADKYHLNGKMPTMHYNSKNRDVVVYNEKTNEIEGMSYMAYISQYAHLKPEDRPMWPIEPSNLDYCPSLPSGRLGDFALNDGRKIPHINLYNPPSYRLNKKPVEGSLHPEFEWFFNHLTDNHEPTKEYLFDWISTVVKGDRVIGILIVISLTQGTGKSTLIVILIHLIGIENVGSLAPKFFSRRFNSQAKNKQLGVIEEIEINDDGITQFKSSTTDDYFQHEEKGKDIDRNVKNVISYIGTSNVFRKLGMDWDARRYIIPNITEVKIDTRLREDGKGGEKEWYKDVFNPLIKDEAELHRLYSFFINRKVVNKLGSSIETFKYNTAKKECLIPQERCLLDVFLNNDVGSTWTMDSLQRELKSELAMLGIKVLKRAISEQKLQQFINNFRWRGVCPIGELTKVNGEYELKSFIGRGAEYESSKFDKEGLWVEAEKIKEDDLDFI